MKTKLAPTSLAALLLCFHAAISTAFAQGNLTPPGAPAPTMKSLDQIEARTPISSAPFTISQSGSYYLTTNVNVSSGNAITIAANGVTVDLNGFVISSTAASATGTGVTAANVYHCTAGLCGVNAINAYGIASYCVGTSIGPAAAGVAAATADHCRGVNLSTGQGINATDIATACYGQSTSGSGITAYIAASCRVGGGTTNITYKYNMP